MNSTASWLLPVLVAIASSQVWHAAVTAFSGRKKVNADATDVVAKNAMTQVTNMETRLTAYEQDVREFRQQLFIHQKWDMKSYADNLRADPDYPSPPEIWI